MGVRRARGSGGCDHPETRTATPPARVCCAIGANKVVLVAWSLLPAPPATRTAPREPASGARTRS
ncbi:hypothetical protein [Streptomyces sp. NPDC052302]|uniref:hypothetical protein n=1 Tax=unclassified Streptomyces TaxID=2593676 RepID=UPI0037D63D5E